MKISVLGCWGVGTVGETTSFLVDIGDVTVLLDTGLAPARQMTKINRVLPEVKAICISHVHADHLQGLPYAIFARGVQERSFGKVPPIKVISHKQGVDTSKQICQLLYPDRPLEAEWIVLQSGESLQLSEKVVISALAVNHTVDSFAYRIQTSAESVVFSSDTLPTSELIKFATGATVLIQEAFGTENDYGKVYQQLRHSLGAQAGQIAQEASVMNLILYHMHTMYVNPEKRKELLNEVEQHYRGTIIFPEDLQILEF